MKKLLFILPLLFLLTACPIGLDYAPGNVGSEKINTKLEGTWVFQETDSLKDTEVMKVYFKKRDNFSFAVTVLERGEMYSLEVDELTAYETKIGNLNIIYLKPVNEDKYYLYQYTLDKGILTIADIPLKVGGVDAVKSTETLREEINASMSMEGFYSEPRSYKKQ